MSSALNLAEACSQSVEHSSKKALYKFLGRFRDESKGGVLRGHDHDITGPSCRTAPGEEESERILGQFWFPEANLHFRNPEFVCPLLLPQFTRQHEPHTHDDISSFFIFFILFQEN